MIFSRFGFGKASNRRFNYVPRYYDADKEEFEQRVDRARRELKGEQKPEDFRERIRQAYDYRSKAYNHVYNNDYKKSIIRRWLIAGLLGAIFYLLITSSLLDRILSAF